MSIVTTNHEPVFDVVSPLGRSRGAAEIEHQVLSTLQGKTLGFIWDYLFKGDEMFQAIEQVASDEFSDVGFVDYTMFGNIHGASSEERANINSIAARIREAEVDAVVVAVGA